MQMNIIKSLSSYNYTVNTATDPPQTLLEDGDQQTLVDTVGYYIQTCWLLQL